MNLAWYGHLKSHAASPLWFIILISWGLALLEYCFLIPATRIGSTTLSLGQLKILQEMISLLLFVPFSMIYMGQAFRLNYLWALLCMLGAAYFIFKE
jgi:uncharacterized protein (DUF486 family)